MNTTARIISFRAQKINSWGRLGVALLRRFGLQLCPICSGNPLDACIFPRGFKVRQVCPGCGNRGLVRVKR